MKKEWYKAYRLVRIILNSKPQNHKALCNLDKILYRAYCVLKFHRNQPNKWDTPIKTRMEQNRIANKIIDEIINEQGWGKTGLQIKS